MESTTRRATKNTAEGAAERSTPRSGSTDNGAAKRSAPNHKAAKHSAPRSGAATARPATKVYLDNASTSFPKPPGVAKAVVQYINDVGCNLDRSGFGTSCVLNRKTRQARTLLAELFNCPDFRQVVLTPSITFALNIVIKGLLKRGDHVLISGMEHNAVTRPLHQLRKRGVSFSVIPCDSRGQLDTDTIAPLLKKQTKAIISLHASNVCGTILPIRQIGRIAQDNGLLYILDSAQTAGVLPIDMQKDQVSVLCFAAHKGLLGAPGVGGFLIAPEIARQIEPIVAGGTGILSELQEMPEDTPMRFEAGTPNLMGYYGLAASLSWVKRVGINKIHQQEMANYSYLLAGLQSIGGLRILGTQDSRRSVAVLAIDLPSADLGSSGGGASGGGGAVGGGGGHGSVGTALGGAGGGGIPGGAVGGGTIPDNTALRGTTLGKIAYRLDNKYRIITRCGLHCAPLANRSLGTFPTGTIRLSPGYFTKKSELDYALAALDEAVWHCTRKPRGRGI